jgi:UDP-glucose 4-epimerase
MTSLPIEHFQSRSVLVTGGAGFIGSHLVEALVAGGARVSVLDNLQAGTWSNLDNVAQSIRRVEGDVRDYAALERAFGQELPEIVFHLAANASVPGSVDEPRYDFETNCGGTFVLLDSLRHLAPTAKVVFTSSAAVYGEPEHFPIVETTPILPISPYGASKVSAEVECRMFFNVYGIPVVIGRVFNSYGPRMPRFAIFDFLRKLHENPEHLEILGNGKQVRDFNYVRDTVSGLLMLGLHGVPGEAYNIASGTSYSITELATMLLHLLGLEEQTKITYSGTSWIGDAQRWEVDISKIRTIGYEPHIGLQRGLKLVIDWFDHRNP